MVFVYPKGIADEWERHRTSMDHLAPWNLPMALKLLEREYRHAYKHVHLYVKKRCRHVPHTIGKPFAQMASDG